MRIVKKNFSKSKLDGLTLKKQIKTYLKAYLIYIKDFEDNNLKLIL